MEGSISWLGKAITSQCEIDDPGCTGSGDQTIARPWGSAPARCEGSTVSVTFTGPPASAVLIVFPSARVILTEGMLNEPLPPRSGGGAPSTLSATIMAVAPAFCTFATFVTNVQVPRSTKAIWPDTALALRIGEQAS